MKRILVSVVLVVALVACARLPILRPDGENGTVRSDLDCRSIFPKGRWQLYHAIEATIPGGRKSVLTGVTVVSSKDRSVECALMTVEGFVLFSARDDGRLTVDRAIAPFDRPGFAQGLMDDLNLLFFVPQEPLCLTGWSDSQDHIFRYCLDGRTTDISVKKNQTWAIRQYTSRNRLARSVDAGQVVRVGRQLFAKRLTLRNHGWLGYQLDLKLVEAVPLK